MTPGDPVLLENRQLVHLYARDGLLFEDTVRTHVRPLRQARPTPKPRQPQPVRQMPPTPRSHRWTTMKSPSEPK